MVRHEYGECEGPKRGLDSTNVMGELRIIY